MHTLWLNARLDRYRPVLSILYLSAGGVMAVVGVMMYLGVEFSALSCVVSLGTIFGVYALNRFTDLREDFANDSARSVFFTQHRGLFRLTVLALAGVVVSLTAAGRLSVYFLGLLAVGVVYSCRLIPWKRPGGHLVFLRFKEVPLVKNVLVSALWGASVFVVPIMLTGRSVAGQELFSVGLLAGAMMLSTFNNTLFGDILDEKGDRLVGTRTLPVLLGTRPCAVVLALVDSLWLLTATMVVLVRPVSAPVLVLVYVLGVYPAVYLVPYWNEKLSRTRLEFLSELDLMVFAVGMGVISLA